MRYNPRPVRRALPRAGDLVSCSGCGRVGVHARQLALSACCGRRVTVTERDTPSAGAAARFVRAVRALAGRGSVT